MKVIYHDKSGRHLSILAAAMHLQLVDQGVSRRELERLPNFLHNKPPGTLLYMGLDSLGNEVYVLGCKKNFRVIRNAYLGINRAFKLHHDIVFADVQPLCNLSIKLFDFANRKSETELKWSSLLFDGLEKSKAKLLPLIEEVRRKSRQREGVI